ncbi:MAG: Hvo_1808 family surface protein [Halobacteriaceae archaeon]
MHRGAIAVVLATTVLLAGCATITWDDATTTTDDPDPAGPDPARDVLGWEDGFWHNDSIAVDQTDGLNDSELQAYVARGMARVEYIRNREFKSDVPVTVISRDQYRSRTTGDVAPAYRAWNNQVWEGLWIVGEDTDVAAALSSTRGSAVAGFYSPSNDAITIITPTPSEPTISNATLIHELVHALQDQYVGLGNPRFGGRTQDAQLAADGLIEGEANYVEARYSQRCGGAWQCVAPADTGDGGGLPADFNFGLFVTIFQPYSDGPVWVDHIIERGGWQAFNRYYSAVPTSTEQIIHTTQEEPVGVTVATTATDGWERFPDQGVDGADTVGEASIYAMFWYQSRTYGADVLDWRAINDVDNPLDTYNYSSPPSRGWANDVLVPYRNQRGEDTDYGYVWKTVWDTERDATQFRQAYLEVLAAHNATRLDPGTWVVPSGPFADAFRITRNGSTVTIVNGPSTAALADIHPRTTDPTETTTQSTTTGATGPGFGLAAALVAVVLAALPRWRSE